MCSRAPSAYLYLAVPVLFWASTPLLVTELARTLRPFAITFFATGFAILVLSLIVTAQGKWGEYRRYSKRELLKVAFMGVIGIFPYTTLYYLALSMAPEEAGEVNIMNYLWPVWIIVLSPIILRERMTVVKVLGVVLSFSGVYLIISGGRLLSFDLTHLPAYITAAAGAFFWGLFSTLGKRHRFDVFTAMLLYNLAALPCFGIVALATGSMEMPSFENWLMLLVLGGLANGLGYVFWILALQKGDTAKISSLAYLTPFVALIYLYLFGRGSIRIVAWVALSLIVTGPLIQRFEERRR